MGYMSRALDKLPDWAKVVLGVGAIATIMIGIAREGWAFLVKMIFSPEF